MNETLLAPSGTDNGTTLPPLVETNPWATPSTPPTDAATSTSPWDMASPPAAAVEVDPWQTTSQPLDAGGADNWLDAPASAVSPDLDSTTSGLHLSQLWDGSLPIESWINQGLGWVVENFPQKDPVELLSQLVVMKDRGLLTEAEFAEQRARILGE